MNWTPRQMVVEILCCHGKPMTPHAIIGAARVMFAARLTRRAVRRACFEAAELKRDGSGAYRIDLELRAERLVPELMAA